MPTLSFNFGGMLGNRHKNNLTFTLREDRDAVYIICVSIIHLQTLARDLPSSNTSIISTGKKFHFTENS